MRQLYLSILLGCITFFSLAQQSKIDSLKNVLTTQIHDTVRLTIYHDLTQYYARRDLDIAQKYCDSLKYISDLKNISKFQIDYYVLKGTLEFYRQNFEKATKTFRKGLSHKKIDSFFYLKSSLINNTSIGFKIQKKLDSFVKYIKYAEKLNLSKDNVPGLLANYNALSDYYINISDFNNASVYLNKLMQLAIKTNNKESLARTNIQLGLISRKELDFKEAILQFQKAINYYENFDEGNIVMIRGMKHEIATSHILNKSYIKAIEILEKIKIDYREFSQKNKYDFQIDLSLLDCYIKTRNLKKARPIYNILSKESTNRGKTTNMVYLLTLSEYEIKFKILNKKTLKRLLKIKKDAIDVKNIEISYLTEKSISQYYALRDENKKAYFHLNKSFLYKDSLSNRDSKIINLAHKRKFNEEKKEKENLQLKADNAQQELLTQKANTRNWLLLLGLIAIGIIAFIIWRRYKSEAKAKATILNQKNTIENLQKELHHRVKNNLAIIDTFIEVAKEEFEDAKFDTKLTELQNRISSINEIHKQLYQNSDVTNLNIKRYIDILSKNVAQSFTNKNINIDKNIENININANTSFPVGLIVNEFLTNSYKYAFEDKGIINIEMKDQGENYILALSDNGKGLPKGFDIEKTETFGLRIVKLLTKQIDGIFNLESNNGVQLTIQIPKV